MSLAEKQAFLCRLYTDRVFRSLFFSDANRAFNFYKLSDEEKNNLLKIPSSEILSFSSGVSSKNKELIAMNFPKTSNYFGVTFSFYLNRYLDLFKFNKYMTVKQHVINFGDFLLSCLLSDKAENDLMIELADYEYTKLVVAQQYIANVTHNQNYIGKTDQKNLAACSLKPLAKKKPMQADEYVFSANFLIKDYSYNFNLSSLDKIKQSLKDKYTFLFSSKNFQSYLINSTTSSLLTFIRETRSLSKISRALKRSYQSPEQMDNLLEILYRFIDEEVILMEKSNS